MIAGPQQRDGGLASVRCDAATALPRQGCLGATAASTLLRGAASCWKKKINCRRAENDAGRGMRGQILGVLKDCSFAKCVPKSRHQEALARTTQCAVFVRFRFFLSWA